MLLYWRVSRDTLEVRGRGVVGTAQDRSKNQKKNTKNTRKQKRKTRALRKGKAKLEMKTKANTMERKIRGEKRVGM